jgi:hypothetical protein
VLRRLAQRGGDLLDGPAGGDERLVPGRAFGREHVGPLLVLGGLDFEGLDVGQVADDGRDRVSWVCSAQARQRRSPARSRL